MAKKIIKPNILCVSTLSILLLMVSSCGGFGFVYRIVQQVVNKIIPGNGFGCLRFLRMEAKFLFQLLDAVAFGRALKT